MFNVSFEEKSADIIQRTNLQCLFHLTVAELFAYHRFTHIIRVERRNNG